MIATWRDGLAWRWRVLAAQITGERRVREAARAQWRTMWSWGGVAFEAELAALDGVPRLARLTLQPDGDVLLCLPRGFGDAADDAARLASLLADVPEQLRAMWLAAQAGPLGVALVLGEAAMAVGAVAVPLREAAVLLEWALSGGAFPLASVLWSGGALALPVALRGAMRGLRGVLLRRVGLDPDQGAG